MDGEPLEVTVARLEERVKGLSEDVAQMTRALLATCGSIIVGVIVYLVTTT